MSVLIWFVLVVLGFGMFGSVGGTEVGSGAEEAPVPSATELPGAESDPFPDDLPFPSTSGEIQERYATRSSVRACGFVDVTSGDAGAQADAGWSCLQDAVGGENGAELFIYDFSDPVSTTTYRVNPDGPLEIFVDRSQSPGTEPTWEYRQCQPAADLRTGPCA